MTTTGEKILDHLASYELKDKHNGRYRCYSPLRAGSDSPSFSLYIHNDGEHGMFKDFVSDESGSLYDLARLLNIEVPTLTSDRKTSKRAYSGLNDYALAHGVEGQVFRDANWREGVFADRPVLFFETTNGTRWRFIDGQKPPYGNKNGYKTCWYGLRRAITLAIPNQLFVLCNGEASTVVAQHYGIGAACLTNSGERSDLTPDLLQQLKESLGDNPPQILVAYDCDKKGEQAAPLMADYLTANGLPAKAINLALGFAGGDLADFCTLYGENSLESLTRCKPLSKPLVESPNRPWQIVKRDYMRTLPPIKWVIEGEIQDHAVNVLVGPPASGKSFLAIDYASKVAQHSSVVYMIGEGDRGINPRLCAWEDHHHKLTDNNLYMCLGAVEIMIEGELSAFIDTIRPLAPKLVIVDTLARAMITGDENSSRDMKAFVAGCSEIVKELDCAVLLVHHTRKDGDLYRGSNVLEGNVDVMLSVTMQDEVIQLKSTKFKDKAASYGKFFRLLPKKIMANGEMVDSAVIIPDEQYEQGDRLSQSQMAILELLAEDEESYYRKDLVEILKLPVGTVANAVKVLQKKGYITKSTKNQPYEITDEGKDFWANCKKSDSLDSLDSSDSLTSESDSLKNRKTDESDESDTPKLPAYRVRMLHFDTEDTSKNYHWIAVSNQKPKNWDESCQLSPERYIELTNQGLPIRWVNDVGINA